MKKNIISLAFILLPLLIFTGCDNLKHIFDGKDTSFYTDTLPDKVDTLQSDTLQSKIVPPPTDIVTALVEAPKTDTSLLNELARIKRENEVLIGRLDSLWKRRITDSMLIAQFGVKLHNPQQPFYYRTVMESPLFTPYNAGNVEFSLQLADEIGISGEHEYHWIYEIYADLLRNYDMYTIELVENIDKVISQFDFPRFDANYELANFTRRLEASQYYNVREKGKHASFRHIAYLDARIVDLKALFADPKKCKKQEFERIKKHILGE